MAYERTCIVDLKKYKYCPHCGGYNSDETWRFIYCSENCKDIDKVLQNYKSGGLSALEAQEALSKLDMSNIDEFHKITRKTIDEIYSVQVVVEEEPTVVDTVDETTVEETTEEKKPKRRRRKTVSTDEISE